MYTDLTIPGLLRFLTQKRSSVLKKQKYSQEGYHGMAVLNIILNWCLYIMFKIHTCVISMHLVFRLAIHQLTEYVTHYLTSST